MKRRTLRYTVAAAIAAVAFAGCSLPLRTEAGAAPSGEGSPSWRAAATAAPAHGKQVIGYITQWDAWKAEAAGYPAQGALTHLNVDMSQYTILNFSFFGVAVDGSLHSGDYRNKNIYQTGVSQEPKPIFYADPYSSWDLHILFGELELANYISADVARRAKEQGFEVTEGGSTWTHPLWGISGSLPLPLHKEGGAPGLLELAKTNGVKLMASLGGWSMCKHFPEMAADPAKRAKFVADCKRLIDLGFDGIDLDWEYPGPFAGMNFTGTDADYGNFLTLVREIRAAIGPSKLITAAMSCAPAKLEGFDWPALNAVMDYYNFMTYDINGGWSDIAGHNSPVHAYPGAETTNNWDSTLAFLRSRNVPLSKVNFGSPFYGRGVVTQSAPAVNAPTLKRQETIQPDGPLMTCADYTNWPKDVYDGTPNYDFIRQKLAAGGWTRHWDDAAKVPYLTKDNFFLSYDDVESIAYKAAYIKANQLAGTIVWTVYGDLQFGGSVTNYGTKLKKWSNVQSPLVHKINEVFADGANLPPTVSISSPADGSQFPAGTASVAASAAAADADGTVVSVELFLDGASQGVKTAAPYTWTLANPAAGRHVLRARATDDDGASRDSAETSFTVGSAVNLPPTVSIGSPAEGATFAAPASFTIVASAADSDGSVASVEFFRDGVSLGAPDASAPYSFAVSGLGAGRYALTARAVDDDGAATTSAAVNVVVTGSGCSLPVWEAGKVYNGGARVHWMDKHYEAKWWTQGDRPDQSGQWGVWRFLENCGGGPTTYVLTPSAGTGGTITPSAPVTVAAGGSQTFSIAASAGYEIDDVRVNGASVGAVASYTFTAVAANATIAATFRPVGGTTFTIAASAGANGTISPSGAVAVLQGRSQAFSIQAASGYQVADVKVNGASVGKVGSYTFQNVQANATIEATFEVQTTPAWASGVAYKLGDLVAHAGSTWVCKYAHTSNAAWVPGTPGLWFWEKQ